MTPLKPLFAAALAFTLAGCASPQKPSSPAMPRIQIAANGQGFTFAPAGEAFVPWGFNYDRDYKMRLLEEYWDSEWHTIVEDFQEMKSLGANVVRVHLQFGKFMSGPGEPNQRALAQLARLLTLAETTGLYLDITGLCSYRKAPVVQPDAPGASPGGSIVWYDALSERDRWNAQADFWQAIARTCKTSPAVFCYNLMNEPVVPAGPRKPRDWLIAELAGFWYVQAITLDPVGRDRAEIARQWIDHLVSAIRKEDPLGLITVGFLPNSLEDTPGGSGFVPSKVAAGLDFVSVHIYPGPKTLEQDLETLRGFKVGKPLVVEEIFPLNGGTDVLRQFMDRAGEHVDGWIGFYWGQTPEELRRQKDIGSAMTLDWLEFFAARGPTASF